MPQQTAQIPLIKGDKVSSNTDYRDSLPVNMYAVKRPIMGASGYMLCHSGLSQIATGTGVDRGAVYNDRLGLHLRVSGEELISVGTDGTVTSLGTVPGTTQVTMSEFYSFNTQAIIADGRMFLYSPSSGFNQVTDSDLGNPIDGVWVDGYYFLTDGEYIYHTDIANETSIDPLKFATAEFMPDKSLGVGKTQDNKVIVFGRYSIEYFINAATTDFAFQRVDTRAQKIGIVATHAKCEAMGSWFFVGSRKNESLGVYFLGVGQSTKVSSREIDKILAKYTEPELADIRMESRHEDDITFVIIHLPQETICLNVGLMADFGTDNSWFYLKTGTGDQVWRGKNGIYDASRGYWCYGDNQDGRIGKLDNTIFDQYGEAQEWYLYTPMVNLTTKSLDQMELETIPGNNVNDDAKLAFSISTDGRVWSQEWWTLYGVKNDYNLKYEQRRLGYINSWLTMRFRGVTTSRMAFSGLVLTYG